MAEPLSVVIPVFNSEASLRLLVEQLIAVLSARGAGFEIILVDDESGDRSWDVVSDLSRDHEAVRGIGLLRNFGQHNALLAGIRAARYPLVVTMDDDLQHPPEEIPKLLAALEKGVDVVYGVPSSLTHSVPRDLMSMATKLVLRHAMRADVARSVSAFRLFRTHLRAAFDGYDSPYVAIDALLTWGTRRFAAVTVEHRPRPYGRSNYTLRRLVRHALTLVTGFSTLPLRFASLLGIASFVFGLGILAWVIAGYFVFGRVVPGFAFLASTIAVFGGVQFLALGLIGEYLARMFVRLMGQPAYVVGRTTDGEPLP